MACIVPDALGWGPTPPRVLDSTGTVLLQIEQRQRQSSPSQHPLQGYATAVLLEANDIV